MEYVVVLTFFRSSRSSFLILQNSIFDSIFSCCCFSPLYQVVRQGSSQQPGEQVLLNNCCSAAVVSVLAPFCLPGSALSLPLLLLVVLVLHVARLGLGGGG